nr:cation:proton antiporter [Actinomycetota bacterium]
MDLPRLMLEISALLAGAVFLGLLARRVRLPLTVVLAVFGFVAAWLGGSLGFESPLGGEEFEEVLVFLFLPVLIFAAALGLPTRSFFRNLGPILVLAVVALAVSAVLVAIALRFGLGTPFAAALLFGVFISATDPVAVVAVFRQLGVPERLLTTVEGESMLNDGVAIVGYN